MYGVCMLEIWVATYVLAGENVLLMGNMDYSATKIFSIFFFACFFVFRLLFFFMLEWNTLSKQNQYKWYERIILVFQWNKSVSKLYYQNGTRLHNNHWTLLDTMF